MLLTANDVEDFFVFFSTNVAFNTVFAELDMYINDTSRDIDLSLIHI